MSRANPIVMLSFLVGVASSVQGFGVLSAARPPAGSSVQCPGARRLAWWVVCSCFGGPMAVAVRNDVFYGWLGFTLVCKVPFAPHGHDVGDVQKYYIMLSCDSTWKSVQGEGTELK